MTAASRPPDFASRLELRPAGVDDWGEIRDLHASAFRRLTAPWIAASACEAFAADLYEPEHTLALMRQDLMTAWLDGHLVGSAGWESLDPDLRIARITAVGVSPFFTRLGIGRRMVETAERRAAMAGFDRFATRAFPPAVEFFEALGYARSAQGSSGTDSADDLPVVFMRKAWPASS